MKFQIDQIAIRPNDPAAARELLEAMGADDWVQDTVTAEGSVFGFYTENKADLNFNYQLVSGNEFEILDYKTGANWMSYSVGDMSSVSHLGMHCSPSDLILWKKFFKDRSIRIAQEVVTTSHSNPVIAGKREYHYVIFATRPILGVDLKFIVRKDL